MAVCDASLSIGRKRVETCFDSINYSAKLMLSTNLNPFRAFSSAGARGRDQPCWTKNLAAAVLAEPCRATAFGGEFRAF